LVSGLGILLLTFQAANLFIGNIHARLQGCCLGPQGCKVVNYGRMAGHCGSKAVQLQTCRAVDWGLQDCKLWLQGCMAAWLHGCWLQGCWLQGCKAAQLHGCWLQGCMAARLHGCKAAWLLIGTARLQGCKAVWAVLLQHAALLVQLSCNSWAAAAAEL